MANEPNHHTLAFNAVPSCRRYRLRLARYKAMAESIAQYLRDENHNGEPLHLLDIGPGSGRSMAFLEVEGFAKQLTFHGIDNCPQRLETIYKPERWQLTKADITQGLPYPSDRFGICVCEQVLEHLPRVDEVIAEIVRVLRPGGLMIVGVPTFPPGITHLREAIVPLVDRVFGWQRGHVQTFTNGRLRKLMAAHPLDLVACRGFRIVSGGPLAPLEDYHWWYRVNRLIGRTVPSLCTEIQLVLRKRKSASQRMEQRRLAS